MKPFGMSEVCSVILVISIISYVLALAIDKWLSIVERLKR